MRAMSGRWVIAAVAAALVAVSCDSDPRPAATSVTTSTTPVVAKTRPPDDGVLRIGMLRPVAAESADIANSVEAGVRLAINEIRGTGIRVELLTADEGGSSVTERSIEELANAGVSAIIGPMSSNVAIANLTDIISRDVLACSPTASALALDEFPDRGLFFRTIPSDWMQAAAIARMVDRTGARTAAVLYVDDDYGRPLADVVQVMLGNQLTVQRFGFSGSDASISAVVSQLTPNPPDAAVLIADPKTGPPVIAAIEGAIDTKGRTFVVNDQLRRAFSGTAVQAQVIGASVQAFEPSEDFLASVQSIYSTATGAFAPYAYDCTMLIALSSAQRGSTAPSAIASEMIATSTGGSLCVSFEECLALLREGRNIDYAGILGTADLTRDGEAKTGRFDVFEIVDGNDRTTGQFTLTR